ncbi:MAG: hypothetical protein H7257_09700 [Taibaiella sp.]|nr:hypothetical protein [Taibaiella sp.]
MTPFTETQRENPLVIIAMAALTVLICVWCFRFIATRVSRNAAIGGCLGLALIFIPFLLFFAQQLTVRIDDNGIDFTYFSGIIVRRHTNWEDIKFAKITTFSPYYNSVRTRGLTLKRHNHEFTISGTTGLRIVLAERNYFILGTRQPDAVKEKLKEAVASRKLTADQIY